MAVRPAPLVLPDGRPFTRDALDKEIAAPGRTSIRTIQSGHPAQGLEPRRLARLLLDAEHGDATAYFELAEEMEEKDLHYLSVLGTRKRAVAQLPIEVEPADDSPEAKADAQLVEDWLDRDLLESELFDILDAIGKGVSATELVWDMGKDAWLPRALKWRDPRFFEFDKETGEQLLLRGGTDGTSASCALPGGKFIVHYHPAKSGLPIRGGLARIAAWGYMFKNFAIKDWVTFLENYGHPLRIGTYGPNESEENKAVLQRALYDLGSDAAAAFPETMNVRFEARSAGTAPNDLWRSHAEYFDLQISKAVLGQTNTTDAQSGGLGSGQAEVHNEVRGDIERADAKILAATLNRDLVVPLVMLNRGPRTRYPRIKIGRPDAIDVKTEIESAAKLAEMGVAIDGEEMRERAGLPAAKSPDSALRPAAAVSVDPSAAQEAVEGPGGAKGPGASKTRAGALLDPLKRAHGPNGDDEAQLQSQAGAGGGNGGDREPDVIDRTVDEALDDWERTVEPMLEPFDRLIDECADLSELQARVIQQIEAMDVSAAQEQLARGGFAARIMGLAGLSAAPAGDDPAPAAGR